MMKDDSLLYEIKENDDSDISGDSRLSVEKYSETDSDEHCFDQSNIENSDMSVRPDNFSDNQDSEEEDDIEYPEDPETTEEADNSIESDNKTKVKKGSPIGIFFKILFSPAMGWKSLKRAGIDSARIGVECFYPICALASLSEFSPLIFEGNRNWQELFVSAVIVFTAYFFSAMIIPSFGKLILGKGTSENIDKPFGREAVMILLSSLGLFRIIFNLLPPIEPVTVFLPLWTIYLITRLPKLLGTPENNRARVIILLSALTIGMPLCWIWALELMMPSV